MQQCSICLDEIEGGLTLACGHRFHAACLARLAGANGTTPTRRGALTTCPNCRTVSRMALTPVAAFGVGDRVDALWGQKWYPGKVDAVVDGGRAYEIVFDDGDEGEVRAAHVRAALAFPTAGVPRRPPSCLPPRHVLLQNCDDDEDDGAAFGIESSATSFSAHGSGDLRAPSAAPTPSTRRAHTRSSGPPPAPRAVVPRYAPARPPPAPAPLPPATRSHVASTSSAWVAVCTDLLAEAVKDRTNMRGLRAPLTRRGFHCGPDHPNKGTTFNITVPPDFPCYYDVVGKDYARSIQSHAQSLSTLRNYLEGALALARAGDAYRTDAEYKPRAPVPVRAAKTSRFTGVHWERVTSRWRASIRVRGSLVELGAFDDEEDAARAYDAARVKYRDEETLYFPGEAPLASVLAALPDAAPRRRSGRAPAPKVIVDAPDERFPYQKRRAKRPLTRETGKWAGRTVEGAYRKANGKWTNNGMFPGREFDDLDAYRAAKKQRVAQKYR